MLLYDLTEKKVFCSTKTLILYEPQNVRNKCTYTWIDWSLD